MCTWVGRQISSRHDQWFLKGCSEGCAHFPGPPELTLSPAVVQRLNPLYRALAFLFCARTYAFDVRAGDWPLNMNSEPGNLSAKCCPRRTPHIHKLDSLGTVAFFTFLTPLHDQRDSCLHHSQRMPLASDRKVACGCLILEQYFFRNRTNR